MQPFVIPPIKLIMKLKLKQLGGKKVLWSISDFRSGQDYKLISAYTKIRRKEVSALIILNIRVSVLESLNRSCYSHNSWWRGTVISTVWWKYHRQDRRGRHYGRVPKGLDTKLSVYGALSDSVALTQSEHWVLKKKIYGYTLPKEKKCV